jgi:hypothetical protein
MFDKPFRWNLTHRHHLGGLLDGERAATYKNFNDDLLGCCSRVVAFAGDSDLVFVGRSPESIFDFLSGLLFDSSWFERLELLHFSMRFREESKIRQEYPGSIDAMRQYLEQIGLHPAAIATKNRPVAFIDLVLSGDTFGRLITFLFNWSNEVGYEWKAVSRRIRIVGITIRTKTSPNTWRWQQHAEWIDLLERVAVKNVSVSPDFWSYLGDYQPKVSRSYTPDRWGDSSLTMPGYTTEQLKALRLAFDLFELGRTREMKAELISYLTEEPAMKNVWFRNLVMELNT